MSEEKGPIYGVRLLDVLPIWRLSSSMRQQLPSRHDLIGVKDYRQGERVVAGYEVMLWHYRRRCGVVLELAEQLAKHTGSTASDVTQAAEAALDKREQNV